MTKNSRSLTCLVTLLFLSAGLIVSAARFVAAGDEPVPSGQPGPAATDSAAAPALDATAAQPASSRALRVRGKVLDDKTGKPIESFTLIGGRQPEHVGRPAIWYWAGAYKRLTGGQYDESNFFPEQYRRQTHALRVEADGYRPAVFLGIADDAGEVSHDFRLRRGGLAGVVRTPDGKPAAGAQVLLSWHEPNLSILNGQIDEKQFQSQDATFTGPEGRYSLAFNTKERSMTVLHESGFAHRSSGEVLTSIDVTLEPWGRIEGVIRLGGKPGAGLEVGVGEEPRYFIKYLPGKVTVAQPRVRHYRSQTKADADGHFVLDRVPPGPRAVYRQTPREGGGFHPSHLVYVDVPAGGTLKVTLGGAGRPVVGRFTSREGTAPTDQFRSAMASLSNNPSMPTPPEFASYSPEQKQKWFDAFKESTEGKMYVRQKQHYALLIAPDGTFRDDDVRPGLYSLTLNVHETVKEEGQITLRGSLAFQRVVNVPEAEAGHGEEPVDVGDAVLTSKGYHGLPIGEALPPLIAQTLDGNPLALADFKNKYVLLAFWASWCAPCRAETPYLKAAFEAFGKDERFVLIGLSLDDTVDAAKQYAVDNGLGWTQGYLGRAPAERVTTDLGVRGIPAIWLIGPDGKVVAKGLRGEKIKEAVTEALAESR